MSLSENMQLMRKRLNLTQEQLAERLRVSRQAVSKWESGISYPETDKLIQLSEMFGCSIDTLIKGEIPPVSIEEEGFRIYHQIKEQVARGIAAGVGLILLGILILLLMSGFLESDSPFAVVVFLFIVAIAVFLLIFYGLRSNYLKKKYPHVADLYSEEEKERFIHRYTLGMSCSVAFILFGVVLMIATTQLFVNREFLSVCIFFACLAPAVSFIVYLALLYDRYDIDGYNGNSTKNYRRSDRYGGVIMLTATFIFLLLGFLYNAWHIAWVAFPLGGILCGIVSSWLRAIEN